MAMAITTTCIPTRGWYESTMSRIDNAKFEQSKFQCNSPETRYEPHIRESTFAPKRDTAGSWFVADRLGSIFWQTKSNTLYATKVMPPTRVWTQTRPLVKTIYRRHKINVHGRKGEIVLSL
jgi:hypothetical protein